MNYASLFAGIGGFDLAFKRAKMRCRAQVEIDKNCLGVLAYHFPNVKRYEDVRNVGRNELGSVDLICGGFPCQDLSVAGRREGLAGERSGLWFEYHRIIADVRPRWVVIENVPGLLSSNEGRDFAVILRGLVECGYGVSWRILDAQYFGLAQRRRRVFIVGSLGNGNAAKILFESEGVSGDSAPSRETGARLATDVAASLRGRGENTGTRIDAETGLVAFSAGQSGASYGIASDENVAPPIRGGSSGTNQVPTIARSLTSRNERIDAETENLVVNAIDVRNLREQPDSISGTLQGKKSGGYSLNYQNPVISSLVSNGDAHSGFRDEHGLVAYTIQNNDGGNHKRQDRPNGGMYVNETDTALTVGGTDLTAIAFENHGRATGDISETIRSGSHGALPMVGVRRLTPTECERLQGFPDGWTAVNGQSDSVRYRQLGNAVAVPVVEWIGRRIMTAEL